MRIREIVESWIDEHFTFVDEAAKEQLIAVLNEELEHFLSNQAARDEFWKREDIWKKRNE